MNAHTTSHCPVAATTLVLYRLQDDPAIRLAIAGDLGWHDHRETDGAGRIAEWSPLQGDAATDGRPV